MCFSASASFGASAVLAGVGVAALKKSGRSPQRLFAAIPLLFAAQQLAEGFVWLSLMHTGYASLQMPAVYLYMYFAYAVWPVWVPVSISLIEADDRRKKILRVFVLIGIIESLYTKTCLIFYGVSASVISHHIIYTFNYPHILYALNPVRDAVYFIATLPAAFVSSRKGVWIFGAVLIGTYVVSKTFFSEAIVSVWCYFAAALSVIVFFIIRKDSWKQPDIQKSK